MTKELIISATSHQTRVAILEDDQPVELYIEQEAELGLAGSIYKGRVTRVLPGMQSAFVNIGLDRDAFLYVSDFFEESDDYEPLPGKRGGREDAETPSEERAGSAGEPGPRPFAEKRSRRERRGRRSRRRRRERSHALPPSKFASLEENGEDKGAREEPEAEPKAAAPAEPEERRRPREREDSGGEEESSGLTLLPGESLAKYRGAADEQSGSFSKEPFQEAGPEEEQQEAPPAGEEEDEAGDGALAPESSPRPGGSSTAGEIAGDEEENAFASPESSAPEEAGAGQDAGDGNGGERGHNETGETRSRRRRRFGLFGRGREERAGRSGSGEADSEQETVEGSAAEVQEARQEDGGRFRDSSPEATGSSAGGPGDNSVAAGPSRQEPEARPSSMPGQPLESGEERSEEESSTAAEGDSDGAEQQGEGERRPAEARLRGRSGSRFRRGRRGRRRGRGPATAAGREPEEAPQQDQSPAEEAEEEDDESSRPQRQNISELLSKGQEIVVQIAKEPLGKKGARITSHIALPGRFLVYMPTVDHIGVSRKIFSEAERHRLRKAVEARRSGMPGGFIVRTAGEGASEDEVHEDMEFLHNLWTSIREKAERAPTPSLLHRDLGVVERVLRDKLGEEFKTVWVDSEEEYEGILRFIERFQPAMLSRVRLYTKSTPIFDAFNVTQAIEKALRPRVWLKSGGYIVINPTEALVAIDVNTGKYVGKSDRLEDTILNTNLEAAKEIVRQIRLRDLGGIIVIDFIDMDDRKNRRKVAEALEEELRRDPAPSKALQLNEFGLLAITRKRVKQSLERSLCSPCPTCSGGGYIKSVETVIYEIMMEARKMSEGLEKGQQTLTLRVNPEVARVLKSRNNSFLQEIESVFGRPLAVRSDPTLHREHFDVH